MPSDSQYLAALRSYYAKHKTLPSYAAIGRLVGLSSKASVAQMIGRLKEQQFLDSAPDRRLRPGKRFFERSIGENLHAGLPSPVEEAILDDLSIDSYLIRDPTNTMLIRVKGDSMVDAGILEKDIVVVERQSTALDGQIVVAVLEGELTLKRLRLDQGRPILLPENQNYAAIQPTEDFTILGVVVGLVRHY
ncbi:LexA repressor [Methylocaldum marinum]|uniref:LexA repressor n=1 Tax=Methylocaldum marinum TaxID=1432792 RepID=A0A250KTV8_9GAMM|nr:S24 family peptidase [Methylocaldum marinum]BBA35085.1 LexA repressor [Methylocaldum marinum]